MSLLLNWGLAITLIFFPLDKKEAIPLGAAASIPELKYPLSRS
jgi:hypothetical protein